MPRQYKYILVPLMILVSLITAHCAFEGVTPRSPEENQLYLTGVTTQTTSMTHTISITNPALSQASVTGAISPTIDISGPGPGRASSSTGVYEEPMEGDELMSDELKGTDPATWSVYTDATHYFRVSHPPYYVIEHLDEAALAELSPTPQAGIYFRDSRNDLAEIAPPEFSILVFENTTQALEDWLTTTGLLKREAGWFTEPYRSQYESGVKVVSTSFMAPGWSVYVTDNTYIYQLTPLGTEADLMLDTFAIER